MNRIVSVLKRGENVASVVGVIFRQRGIVRRVLRQAAANKHDDDSDEKKAAVDDDRGDSGSAPDDDSRVRLVDYGVDLWSSVGLIHLIFPESPMIHVASSFVATTSTSTNSTAVAAAAANDVGDDDGAREERRKAQGRLMCALEHWLGHDFGGSGEEWIGRQLPLSKPHWSTSLPAALRVVEQQEALMNHWRRVLPARQTTAEPAPVTTTMLLTLHGEVNWEGALASVLAHCGLSSNDASTQTTRTPGRALDSDGEIKAEDDADESAIYPAVLLGRQGVAMAERSLAIHASLLSVPF